MVQQLNQQAYLLAMNDAFLVTMSVIFLTIFIVLFVVRAPRKKGVALPNPEHMALSGAPVEEEEHAVSVARKAPCEVSPGSLEIPHHYHAYKIWTGTESVGRRPRLP